MTIAPAILTSSEQEFGNLLQNYIKAGFTEIDIDIQDADFASAATITFSQAARILQILRAPADLLVWDLKIPQPGQLLTRILNMGAAGVVVYQSANLDGVLDPKFQDLNIGLGILPTDELLDLDFYSQFAWIQIMTIQNQSQGGELDTQLLNKAKQLKDLGYGGVIGIDGGVNLDSAKLIDASVIGRVSVGSYFQNSKNIKQDLINLQSCFPQELINE